MLSENTQKKKKPSKKSQRPKKTQKTKKKTAFFKEKTKKTKTQKKNWKCENTPPKQHPVILNDFFNSKTALIKGIGLIADDLADLIPNVLKNLSIEKK